MDLTRLVKHIKSDEAESSVVVATILADVFADHEAHVHFPVQTRSLTGYEVVVSALPTHVREANKAIEIRDRGWVVGGRVGINTGHRVARRLDVEHCLVACCCKKLCTVWDWVGITRCLVV